MADKKSGTEKAGKQKNRGGRKPLWDLLDMPSKLSSVQGWAMHGSTINEIAKMIGVSEAVVYEWQKNHAEFREAIKKGRHVSNGELLNSAFRQATGMTIVDQQAIKIKDYKEIDGKFFTVERVELVAVERYIPPNPIMSIFMIKNRLPADYRDKQEHSLVGTLEIVVQRPADLADLVKTQQEHQRQDTADAGA